METTKKTCLNCTHCHKAKDLEFDLIPHDQHRKEIPNGKCFVNIDLYWCDKPEVDDDDFTVLSYGTPSQFDKEVWFPQLASVCGDYGEWEDICLIT